MNGYEAFTLEEFSLVFKEDSHTPLATSDMGDWLSQTALGKALGKQRGHVYWVLLGGENSMKK